MINELASQQWMQKALAQARNRRGFCAPNPAVGAVIVKDGLLIAEGTHFACGKPHAEVDAFNQCQTSTMDADLYVTLEPCCHYGKTPPCTDLIIKKGIRTVYYGVLDPNSLVAGRGIAQLEQAGIRCQQIALTELENFYRSYFYWHKTKKPWMTAKLALSGDGKIAGINGQPIQITGPGCKTLTHQWRKRSDAILTTVKTIAHDDPQLNARMENEVIAKPVYILDRQLKLLLNAKIFSTAKALTVFHGNDVAIEKINLLQQKNVRCIEVPEIKGRLDLSIIIEQIGKDGMHDLWVEAGGCCFQALFAANLLNSAFLYFSSKTLGENAYSAFDEPFDITNSAAKATWQQLENDLVCQLEW